VQALRSAYTAGHRILPSDYALSRDADIYEKARRDPVIKHCWDLRLHMVAGHRYAVEPRGDKPPDRLAAAIIGEMLDDLPAFTTARAELANAIFFGRTFQLISGEKRWATLAGKTGNWWVPTALTDIDSRRFRFKSNRDENSSDGAFHVTMELHSPERGVWETVEHPEWFVKHIYGDDEARLGYGRGLIEAIYFYYWVKTTVMKEGLEGLERWAQGMIVAKIDGMRAADTDKPNATLAQAWLDTIEATRGRHFVAVDKIDEVSVVEPQGQGHAQVESWLAYLDDAMSRLILASVRSSGGATKSQSGARAQAETEADSRSALIAYDRQILDETITRDLVGAIWRYNTEAFMQAGCYGAKMPRFRTVEDEHRDPLEAMELIKGAREIGLSLREDEVFDAIGFSPVLEGEKAVEFAPMPDPLAVAGHAGDGPPQKDKPGDPSSKSAEKPDPDKNPDKMSHSGRSMLDELKAYIDLKLAAMAHPAPQSHTTINVPEVKIPPINVTMASPEVHPVFNVPEPPRPEVTVVNQPPNITVQPAPVTFAEQAPVVNVTVPTPAVEVNVSPVVRAVLPTPTPKSISIKRNDDGSMEGEVRSKEG
jgi:phage gp29-like protein